MTSYYAGKLLLSTPDHRPHMTGIQGALFIRPVYINRDSLKNVCLNFGLKGKICVTVGKIGIIFHTSHTFMNISRGTSICLGKGQR